ncbi:metallopeptidase family protein [Raineyella sp. LH-20]|uniref:metallopeptidase family protein n=1 Tax=Raineyella sp. LH-20 TaxID=3081204 RepID=UPI002952A72D|nr:metallopeptidase family protein [Raineyella sp. LH-20]WOP18397.1 metallopeptidase family protein [Raineyella sp. LH-20]
MLDISAEEFERYVDEAVESVPAALLDLVENCILVIEDEPPLGEPHLLGLYQGVPLDRRGIDYSGVLPDRILIFRTPLMRMCRTPAELREQVRVTVVHEIGHFFGIDDARLHELGYA